MDSYPRRSRSPRDDYRARSPASFDRRPPPRRRSRSPVAIDRYQPDREYVPPRHDEYRRRASPPPNIDRYVPGQDSAPRDVPLFNPIPNPLALESQAGFTYFMEWWRKEQEIKDEKERQKTGARRPLPRLKGEQESREEREKERGKIQAAYDAYKEKYSMQMAKAFVHLHKDEEWFKERYDPDIRDPLRLRLNEFRKGHFAVWCTDLDKGVFDEFTLEGIYKNDSNGAGGVVEKEEGEAMASTEVLGVSDLVPSKGADLRDEASLQPALLVKTIAPHVSHDQLEAFCKEHLGDGDGGFRWLSLSDPNPTKKFHRIGWVLLNPSDEPTGVQDGQVVTRDESNAGEDGTTMEDAEKPSGGYVQRALSEVNGKSIEDETRGNFQCHVGIHVPQTAPRKKALWDLFSAPERVERDLELVERLVSKLEQELGEDINGVTKIEERVEHLRGQGLLQPQQNGGASKADAKMQDADEDEDGEVEDNDEGTADDEADDEELILKKKKLDLLTEYLRRVFNFCFFCVFECDSVHELGRKCPGGHLRRPRATLTSSAKTVAKASAYGEEFPLRRQAAQDDRIQDGDDANGSSAKRPQFQKHNKNHQQLQRAFNWVKTYEDKLFQILEPDSADLAKLGGKPLPEAEEDELKKFVSREDENKFRCKVPDCTKLFKSETYWQTHVQRRHEEWLAKVKKELLEINNYVLDPSHIVPSRNDANSTGHFVPNSQVMSGTPRNFNPHNMGPGQLGAMRSGRGRMGARQAGPYDRLPQDSRNARWRGAGGGGRMDGGRGLRPPQAHPDALAVGGGGSREATAGRSLKSYEDLDAVGGSSNGALDY